MGQLHVSLTLPGAVSLGAYEGGALAALLVGVQGLDGDVVVDSIGSASAGSITGLLAARCLAAGADPVRVMKEAWVDLDSLKALKTHDLAAPLSAHALAMMAAKVLPPAGVPGGTARVQPESVRLSMALASLAGLNYELVSLQQGTSVTAATYVDWYPIEITTKTPDSDYQTYAEAAIASGSNAVGFPPELLDRSRDRSQYVDAGVINFPESGELWYTDGGTIDNEPLGRTLGLARAIPPGDRRVYLLIHPEAAAPAAAGPWQQTEPRPSWFHTAMRALSISQSQSIYDDLKRLEKTNSHILWTRGLPPDITGGLNDAMAEAGLSGDQQATLRRALVTRLQASLRKIHDDQERIRGLGRQRLDPTLEATAEPAPRRVDDPPSELGALLSGLIAEAAGLSGKDVATVEVVSPALGAQPGGSPTNVLAGAFLFHFGGFIDIRFRQSDFALGYRNMQTWLSEKLAHYLDTHDRLAAALGEVQRRYDELGWDHIRFGGASFSSLSFGQKLELLGLTGHIAHVSEHDLRHWKNPPAPASS